MTDDPYKNIDISKFMSSIQMNDPMRGLKNRIQMDNEQLMRAVDSSNRRKEVERQELLEAIKGNPRVVNTITVGRDATGLQIGTVGSTQTVSVSQEYNYEKASEVLEAIKEYFDEPKLNSVFGDKADEMKQFVTDTLEMVERKAKPTLIQRSLNLINGLAVGACGSLIATGILELLKQVATK